MLRDKPTSNLYLFMAASKSHEELVIIDNPVFLDSEDLR